MIDINELRMRLKYNPDNGEFVWARNIGNVKAGAVAGCVNQKGYRYISVFGRLYRANRLAWIYVHGSEPVGQIDHKDGNRLNNKISNLRDVDGFTNQQNRRLGNKNSTSKLLGVSFHKGTGKWRAQITERKTIHIGLFNTELEAHNAYLQAKKKIHGRNNLERLASNELRHD